MMKDKVITVDMDNDTKFDMIVTQIPEDSPARKIRIMDFGRWPVCSICGKSMACEESKCCGERTSLKEYYERVHKKQFNNKEWKFMSEEINLMKDVDLNKEVVYNK